MAWFLRVLLLLLSGLTSVAPLFCYTCVFPTHSPTDCIRFPVKCPPDQLCLTSRAVGHRGEVRVELWERSCVLASMCGQTGQKHTMGLNFTFTNTCCRTNLCNHNAPTTSRAPPPHRGLGPLTLLWVCYGLIAHL
uniref:UPAR/Ly6 domain-containing protein n=1 Tax=Knipowitschia caucasica TaxID=637954 RepID=A0AAV2MFG9_KNICA